MNTQDLSKFGFIELKEAGKLLTAYGAENWAKDSDLDSGIAVEFNPESGNVFLVDENYNVAMLNEDGQLENWLNCGDCGNEGFRSEITLNDDGTCSECKPVSDKADLLAKHAA